MQDALGWLSSAILLTTITAQVVKQWRTGTSKGVSIWLFVGQVFASTGFVIYSAMVDNMVFVCTNALILVSAVVGVAIMVYHKRRERRTEGQH